MLPIISLKSVSRDDVDRVAWWLEDAEVSSRWFGQYAWGEPIHRSYEPTHMLESSDTEWLHIFGDPKRLIFSIYNDQDEHVGECQIILDGQEGAELSLLIGRKDLWHQGYGAATVLVLMDRIFSTLKLSRAWVNVPEDNLPALGLFEKLGFLRSDKRQLMTRSDGTVLSAYILTIDARSYLKRQPVEERPRPSEVVTVTGLPGSGSEEVAYEVANMLGSRLVDNEIRDELLRRLKCSAAELEGFEASFRSFWTRLLNSVVVPMEWSATYDAAYVFRPDPSLEHDLLSDQLTREQYEGALTGVVKRLCREGGVIMHGHGSHRVAANHGGSLNVFVAASFEKRAGNVAAQGALSEDEAAKRLKDADGDVVSVSRHLWGGDIDDTASFDFTVNLDRMTAQEAARLIVGALGHDTSSPARLRDAGREAEFAAS
jgi:RimJ/RimL family protein N-acetyltransferase/cytidylate kinase